MDESLEVDKILIIDDVPGNIRVLAELLTDDYDLSVATSGKNIIALVAENPPDLILLDIVMPEISGYDVCRALKEDPRAADIPVIFITSKDSEEDEQYGLELGAIDYISKPFNASIVKVRVKNHIELKKSKDQLRALSNMDGLTRIANRRRFDAYLRQEWLHALRARSSLGLILLDIDHFKLFNDNYGHIAGDDCLKKVAQCIDNTKQRITDLVARYGGEEFVCVLPYTDKDGINLLAEKIRSQIAALGIPHSQSPTEKYITVSLGGISAIPSRRSSLEQFVKAADNNLYQAKKQGRNCHVSSTLDKPEQKVLLVDDDNNTLNIVSQMIQSWNLPVQLMTACNGIDALLKAGQESPNIIITDINMPHMNGIAMIQEIKKSPLLNGLQIIVLTALSPQDIQQTGHIPEGIPVLQKPLHAKHLRQALEKLLRI